MILPSRRSVKGLDKKFFSRVQPQPMANAMGCGNPFTNSGSFHSCSHAWDSRHSPV